jgi:GNAT superfamily N-acetyltransferase
MDINLRAGKPEDAAATGEICYEAFKRIAESHNFPKDFPSTEAATGLTGMLLSRPDVYSVVAEIDGETVGSNFLWKDVDSAGVGPITVNPQAQNSNVGRMLMEAVIRHGEENGYKTIRLVQAAYHNRSLALYTKLGFDTVEPLSTVQGAPLDLRIEGYKVRSMTAGDVEQADRLCYRVHGLKRTGEIAGAASRGVGMVVEHLGRITGYTTTLGFFGHTVGETNEDVKALIGAAREFAGPGFLLPTRNNELMRWCLENGLRIVQPLTLMSKGLYQEPRGAFLPSILY